MAEVTLAQMLEARDARAMAQQAMLARHSGAALISFTLNIPGPIKNNPAIQRAFDLGCAELLYRLPKGVLLEQAEIRAITGCEALWAIDFDPIALKKICVALEDGSPLGRLFDMDVLTSDGVKLDRALVGGASRDCIVCGAPGQGCASRRLHSVEQLQAAAFGRILDHFIQLDSRRMAALAVRSLLDEVCTTPKPGLVDRQNSGSHRDMDIFTFNASASALFPYFETCVTLGMTHQNEMPEQLFLRLRQAGLTAEQEMYRVTKGINTHKGAIFTLGLLCGAAGYLWQVNTPSADLNDIREITSRMAQAALQADLRNLDPHHAHTAGQKLWLRHGKTGIRGQLADGLPAVFDLALPAWRQARADGLCRNDAGLYALLHLITNVEDTNLLHRGGWEGARWAADQAKALLDRTDYPTCTDLAAMDAAFTARNLSPGGCADLLAVVYFLDGLSEM